MSLHTANLSRQLGVLQALVAHHKIMSQALIDARANLTDDAHSLIDDAAAAFSDDVVTNIEKALSDLEDQLAHSLHDEENRYRSVA